MVDRWPTVGRAAQFEQVSAILDATDGPCGVVLAGAAGVGKTTLARAVVQAWTGRSTWVAGTASAGSVPLGAFAHLVEPPPGLEPAAVLRAARTALVGGGPMAIGVDDAHLLDRLSATLLHQLAATRSVRLVATVPWSATAPDAVTALWKDQLLTRIDLAPFDAGQTRQLLEAVLGGDLEDITVDRIHRLAGGNPLYLRQLIEGALRAGRLAEVGGVWQLRGQPVITPQLGALVGGRLDALPAPQRRVVDLVALHDPLPLPAAVALAGREAVEAVERADLVALRAGAGGPVVAPAHPMYGEVARARLGAAAARRLRGELVGRLAAAGSTRVSDRLQLAALALDSDTPPHTDEMLSAARDALRLGELELAERLARAAMDADAGFEAVPLLANSLVWQGRADEAEQLLAAVDWESLPENQRVAWLLPRVGNLFWMLGRVGEADAILNQVRATLTSGSAIDVTRAVSSMFVLHTGAPVRAIELAGEVLDSQSGRTARLWALVGLVLAGARTGHFEEVDAVARNGIEQVIGSDYGYIRLGVARAQILTRIMRFDLPGAERLARDIVEGAEQQQPARALGGVQLGLVAMRHGKLDLALDELRQSAAALAGAGFSWEFEATVGLCQAYAATGRVDEAERALARARELEGESTQLFAPELAVAQAWVYAARGNVAAAVEAARGAAEVADRAGQRAVAVLAAHLAVRFGDRAAAGRLARLAAGLDVEYARLVVAHARAVEASDAAALESISRTMESGGALLEAAETAARAAVIHRRAGRHRREWAAAARARALTDRCGGANTPALVEAQHPLPLTARELEIASMVARGMSNREIADRLVVSVRTVEGHIYHSCTKLDVADRAELAQAFIAQ
ncbi:helix-turn-helix transcriptional regulator [Speluncibacter jeojiensis]|uniref:LuxR C-terminal-related transcriptional regulator n=1 Tax=Speluncibacter jeojiensis TaxID=2710754 RepID=A0A9X4M3R9_9ACTN|nr:LuxR C-terminal-related transcriptional regulator [Corynebacteriales bacterium D3-21]